MKGIDSGDCPYLSPSSQKRTTKNWRRLPVVECANYTPWALPSKRTSPLQFMCFLLAPLTKVVRLPVAHHHWSCHVEADHGHLLAAVNFYTRSAVWTRFLTEPVAGLLTLLVVFRQKGWRECSSLGLPRLFGCPSSLAETGWAGLIWRTSSLTLSHLALWHATAPMLMVSNHSCGGARAAVGNVNSNASGLERAAKRYRLLAAAASLAGHLISKFTI